MSKKRANEHIALFKEQKQNSCSFTKRAQWLWSKMSEKRVNELNACF